MVGRHQIIDVGPMSGKSNVIYWLKKYSIEPSDGLVNEIFKVAKDSEKLLTEDEIMAVVERVDSASQDLS